MNRLLFVMVSLCFLSSCIKFDSGDSPGVTATSSDSPNKVVTADKSPKSVERFKQALLKLDPMSVIERKVSMNILNPNSRNGNRVRIQIVSGNENNNYYSGTLNGLRVIQSSRKGIGLGIESAVYVEQHNLDTGRVTKTYHELKGNKLEIDIL